MNELLDKIQASGGTIEVIDGDLRIRVPKGLLSDQDKVVLVERRDQVIRLLEARNTVQELYVSTKYPTLCEQNMGWDQAVEPIPCSKCGEIMAWWDILGGRHCSMCEASGLQRSVELIETASRLRRRSRGSTFLGGRRAKTVVPPRVFGHDPE